METVSHCAVPACGAVTVSFRHLKGGVFFGRGAVPGDFSFLYFSLDCFFNVLCFVSLL